MARTRSERARSKPSALDDLVQSIEALQGLLLKIEDLGRDGFPYLEGARARTELQLREAIKRAFGEKSPEFQTHRQHKLSIGSSPEHKHSITLIKTLIGTLEDRKRELQGPSATPPEESEPTLAETRPRLTVVTPDEPASTTVETSASSSPSARPSTPPEPAPAAYPVIENAQSPASPSHETRLSTSQPVSKPASVSPSSQESQLIAQHQTPALFRPHETGSVTPLNSPAPQRPSIGHTPATSPKSSTSQEASDMSPAPIPSQTKSAPIHALEEPAAAAASPVHTPLETAPMPPQLLSTQELSVPSPPTHVRMNLTEQRVAADSTSPTEQDTLGLCKQLCQRFHAIARQLRLRGEYRTTLSIEDEIDAQDLLHALLRVQFDDIGADEWIPGYANDQTRTTFLLDHNRLAVIVKKTRAGLTSKDLAEQVRIDAERYRVREQCTGLFCFIYDPDGRIGNPRGMEHDLATVNDHFTVNVFVAPKS